MGNIENWDIPTLLVCIEDCLNTIMFTIAHVRHSLSALPFSFSLEPHISVAESQ